MSYPLEKALGEEVQDERLSAEIGLLRKADAEYDYSAKKALKRRFWIVPLLVHTAILATYTIFFLAVLWSLKSDSKCRLPNSIDCEHRIYPVKIVI